MDTEKVVISDTEPQEVTKKQTVNALSSNNLIFDGFQFYTIEDAEIATAEQKKIEFLSKKLNFSNPASIHQVYEKIVEERMFKTPVGLSFLKQIQNILWTVPA